MVLSGNGLEYDFDDIDYGALSRMCFHIDSENPVEEAPKLTPPHQSPRSYANYLHEKAARPQAQQADLEATETELKHQR
jgi:hypothetical protein